MGVHGASAGPGAGAGLVPTPPAPTDSLERVPATRLSGAPPWARIWNPPGCSPMLSVAGAEPVFLMVSVGVAVACQLSVLSMLSGVTVSWPALRLKFARVAKSGATLTV